MGIPGAGTYEFDADLTLEEMQALLNAGGPWAWVMGDSYWYGDYLRARPHSGLGKVGIMEQRQSPLYAGGPAEPRYLIWVSAWPARGEGILRSPRWTGSSGSRSCRQSAPAVCGPPWGSKRSAWTPQHGDRGQVVRGLRSGRRPPLPQVVCAGGLMLAVLTYVLVLAPITDVFDAPIHHQPLTAVGKQVMERVGSPAGAGAGPAVLGCVAGLSGASAPAALGA